MHPEAEMFLARFAGNISDRFWGKVMKTSGGWRQCRTCQNDNQRRRRAEKRGSSIKRGELS